MTTRLARMNAWFARLPAGSVVTIDLFAGPVVVLASGDAAEHFDGSGNWYGPDGFDSDGVDADGYDREGRDSDGFDREGYDADGYDADGYDADGYDADGYDADGYDADGYDRDDLDSSGNCRNGDCGECPACNECELCGSDRRECECFTCDACNERFESHRYGEDGRCEECSVIGGVHGYHDAPVRKTWNLSPRFGDHAIGCELEIYARNRSEVAESAPEWMACERDGSLDEDHGLELIGPPMPASDFLSDSGEWSRALARLPSGCKGHDAGTGYGMHVHISRNTLTDDQQVRMVLFVHRNRALVETVAQRKATGYCQISDRPARNWDYDGDSHGYAVSIRRHTLEFRSFRSTLRADRFRKNVQFVLAVADWCRDADLDDTVDTTGFVQFVHDNPRCYPDLARFLAERPEYTSDPERHA